MYVKVDSAKYTEISRLSFAPETDVTGSAVPINELTVSIRTTDQIAMGSRVSLYDDLDRLWAKYWVVYAEREDTHTVQVRGQSALSLLDRKQLDPVMWDGTSIATALADILAPLGGEWTLDQSFSGRTLSGYCPKQNARVRLQWVCMAIGAYLKNFFNDRLEILPIDDEAEGIIPADRTYWKPSVTYRDHVTAITATYYTYTEETPHTTDTWVEVGGRYYVQTETVVTLTNDSAPAAAPENVVELDAVTIINEDNVDEVLSHLAKYYFRRIELDLEAVDNGEWVPGERVTAFSDEESMVTGYIGSCDFTFGVQAKARIHMTPVEVRDSANLTITYMWDQKQIGVRTYRFPVGYAYEITNPYLTLVLARHWYVFRPTSATISGTIQDGDNSRTQPEQVALDLYEGDLMIHSVDAVALSDGIAVIA